MVIRGIKKEVMGFSAYVFVQDWGLTLEQGRALKLTPETVEVPDEAGAALVAAGIAEEVLS